jgi:DNA mismatch endonuclease (patch repair protein)
LTDNLTDEQRRHAMRRVQSKDTTPELLVRSLLRRLGHTGYRLYRADISGKPDIAWIGRKQAIFINGCFWHGHNCPRGAREPKTRVDYWRNKISRTKQRDIKHVEQLTNEGWSVLTLWECELCDERTLIRKLTDFFA